MNKEQTQRFSFGPFQFTFRNGRVWWRYKQKHFGTRIQASGATSISTGEKLLAFLTSPDSIYGKDGLLTFVRFHFADIPGALHWAEHYTRCRSSVTPAKES